MKKYLGIDFGLARIGLSVSNALGMMASPHGLIKAEKDKVKTLQKLLEETKTLSVSEYVVGLPLLMNGKDSDMTTLVREFAKALEEATQKPVHLWDERLTSQEVDKIMIQGSVKRKKRAQLVDTLSATLLLQNFLDSKVF